MSDLRQAGLISSAHDLGGIAQHYDIGITSDVLQQIGKPDDAVARQYVPSIRELDVMADEENDPIGDEIYTPTRGIVHRYPDRVLFKVAANCAVYCRYCFRREMIGRDAEQLNDDDFDAAIDYIKAHSEIWEVILTGGDPLILSPRRLDKILRALDEVDHVQIVRIHTRIPIANPSRIDDTLLSVLKLKSSVLQVVVHVNHVQEISEDVEAKISQLRQNDIALFSQSVLLRLVNDDAKTLEALFRKLLTMHVRPYYLHHLDHAKGTSHFRVSLQKGMDIMRTLQGRISGTALPKYMLDIPGGHGKVPVISDYVQHVKGDLYRVTDYQGCTHLYVDALPKSQEVAA